MGLTIAISRQFGAGGATIGRTVAQALGYRYADRDILAEAARLLEVDDKAIEALDEHAPGFWSRLGKAMAYGTAEMPSMPAPGGFVTEADVLAMEQAVIKRLAIDGRVVIVGRGSAFVLDPNPRVLRVFLHAPRRARVSLAMREYGIGNVDEAVAAVNDADRARGKLAKALTGHEWHDATLFDVCFDTAGLGADEVAGLIVQLAHTRERALGVGAHP
jgi:CMP/dCMP kinase